MHIAIAILVIVSVAADHHDGGSNFGGGSFGDRVRPPPTPYLQGQNQTVIQAWVNIVNNETTTIAQQQTAIQTLAQTYNFTAALQSWNASETQQNNYERANVSALIQSLPALATQLNQILDNTNQTPQQLEQAVRSFAMNNTDAFDLLQIAAVLVAGDEENTGGYGNRGGNQRGNFHSSRGNFNNATTQG